VDKYLKQNRAHWNEITPIHEKSPMYDIAGFKGGKCSLKKIELDEVGDVRGKSLLHLQCHFGMDTMSWARLGAKTTGVDFGDEAIKLARKLSKETGIKARFIEANIYNLPEVLKSKYDIVFTSYGVLSWIPDLEKWARIISQFLKRGGYFYIVEFHPVITVCDDTPKATKPDMVLPYFNRTAISWAPAPDYASGASTRTSTYQWQYPLADVISSLIAAGLKIDFLHEFPICNYQALPYMKKQPDGWWHIEGDPLPLLFSLKATK
jgi:ubiquinone/menaquinone biosynthesis C-methylase UbiE